MIQKIMCFFGKHKFESVNEPDYIIRKMPNPKFVEVASPEECVLCGAKHNFIHYETKEYFRMIQEMLRKVKRK